MSLDHDISIIVRETLVDNVYVSAAGLASVLRNTVGSPHLPPAPFLSRAAGEEGGIMPPHLPPNPLPLPRCGRGMGGSVAILRRRLSTIPSPSTRSSPLPQCGRGAGGEGCPLTFPPTPFRSRAAGEEGGMWGLERKNVGTSSRNSRTGTVRA